jgi:hypothetical protein
MAAMVSSRERNGKGKDKRAKGGTHASCGEEGGAMGWLHGKGARHCAASFVPVCLYVLLCCLREQERKEKREKRNEEREGEKNVENFPNLKIFREKNKRQFMKLV